MHPSILGTNEVVRRATRESRWVWFFWPGLVFAVSAGIVYLLGSTIWGSVAIGAWLWRRLPPVGRLTGDLQHTVGTVPYLLAVLTVLALLWFLDRGLRLFFRWWRWRRDVYVVTSYRLIHQHGILSTNFREIPLLQVRDVDVDQNVPMRILGFGWVLVNSLQTAPTSGAKPYRPPHPRRRRPGDAVGLEEWLAVPDPYGIERDIESQTEGLLASRAGVGPIGGSR